MQQRRLSLAPGRLRLLHAWHLWSLDAPTVAACWTMLFCRVAHVAHAAAAATALSCAVWLVYAADRLLDSRRSAGAETGRPSELTQLYLGRQGLVVAVAAPVVLVLLAALFPLPSALVEAWLLLAIPLFGYGVGVHLLGLPARWKAISVGVFFGAAVVLPAATNQAVHAPMLLAAVVFGGVCRLNCEVLRRHAPRLRLLLCVLGPGALALALTSGAGAIGCACLLSLLLLAALRAGRDRFSTLTYRALADAALVAAPLLLLIFCSR